MCCWGGYVYMRQALQITGEFSVTEQAMTTKLNFWLWEGPENKGINPHLVEIYDYFFKLSISLSILRSLLVLATS